MNAPWLVEPALGAPPYSGPALPAARGRGRGRGPAGGGVAGAAACGVVRGGGDGRPRRGGTMELGSPPRRRRRHRGPVSAGGGRPGSPVPAPSLLVSGPRGCPRGRRARTGTPQPRGQVKLLHRAWCARARGGAHCGPRRRPAPCLAARLHPSLWLPRRPRLPAVAARPGGRSRSCRHAALRLRRCPVRARRPRGRRPPSRLQVAPRPPLAPHARRPGPASVRDRHSLPGSARPRLHLAQPRCPPPCGPAPSVLGFALRAPLRPQVPAPHAPCSGAAGPRGSRPQQTCSAVRAQGRGSGSRRGAGRWAADRSRFAWMHRPQETFPARRRGPRRLALAPPPRRSVSE